jgi:hypothetical protein
LYLEYSFITQHFTPMKTLKIIAFFALLLTFSLNGFSQTKTGQVYLIRVTGYTGSAVNYRFYVDDTLICKLKNKSFSIHNLPVGAHTVSVSSGGISNGKKSDPLKILVVEGEVNYISVVSTQSGYANKITCQEITKNSADPLLAKSTENKDCLPTEQTK